MSERIYQDHAQSGRGQPALAEFAWTSDACEKCGASHFDEGCCAVLPVALMIDDGETVVFAYRCRHGHDWTTAYQRDFAIEHGEASRRELADAPHWPDAPPA